MNKELVRKIIFELYYKEQITPNDHLNHSVKLLDEIKSQKRIDYKIINDLTIEQEDDLKDEIRIAAGRWKYKVVTKGGGALVISGNKKLNYQHGPILVVRRNNKIIEVFPRGDPGSKESRWTTIDFLLAFQKEKSAITEVFRGKTFSENDLRNLIKGTPGIIENGLKYSDIEVEIESSRIDLVLIDKKNRHLLLEFKLNATDKTVGQVTRYNFDRYSEKFDLPKDSIRRGIVTLSVTGQIADACKEQNIELYIIKSKNMGFKKK
ncbi:MAG: endonuclease NucS domain-containing protein [Candidatus Heimdallarchaeota archaeon]